MGFLLHIDIRVKSLYHLKPLLLGGKRDHTQLLTLASILFVQPNKGIKMIRKYKNADRNQVAAIYDLSKPDEMKGVLDPQGINPFLLRKLMLRRISTSTVTIILIQEVAA